MPSIRANQSFQKLRMLVVFSVAVISNSKFDAINELGKILNC